MKILIASNINNETTDETMTETFINRFRIPSTCVAIFETYNETFTLKSSYDVERMFYEILDGLAIKDGIEIFACDSVTLGNVVFPLSYPVTVITAHYNATSENVYITEIL